MLIKDNFPQICNLNCWIEDGYYFLTIYTSIYIGKFSTLFMSFSRKWTYLSNSDAVNIQ